MYDTTDGKRAGILIDINAKTSDATTSYFELTIGIEPLSESDGLDEIKERVNQIINVLSHHIIRT